MKQDIGILPWYNCQNLVCKDKESLYKERKGFILHILSLYTQFVFCRYMIPVVTYEACPESGDRKVLNMYNIFNLQKWQCEWIVRT